MKFIFPFSEISKNERIVLYGASECGYNFYQQIVSTGYVDMVLWVDRQYEWYQYINLPVESPHKINNVEYDRIVVTAETKQVYQSILNDLKKMNIDEKKIFWKENSRIIGDIAAVYDENRVLQESKDAISVSPMTFVSEDRLDIVIRILYAQDIISDNKEIYHQNLYRKLMMVQNGGKEPTENMMSAFFSDYIMKSGWEAFDSSFRKLIFSIKENGYLKEHFVPVSRNGYLINGAHRIAVAVALKEEVWIRDYPVDIKALIFDSTWMENNGFDKSEIEYVREKYRGIV